MGGVVVHDISPSEGYPELNLEKLASQMAESKKPVEFISTKEYPDNLQVIEKGVRVAR